MCKSKMKTDATEPPPPVSPASLDRSRRRTSSRSSVDPSSRNFHYSSSAASSTSTNPPPLEAQRFKKPVSTSSDTPLDFENFTTGTGSSFLSGSTSSVSTSLRNSLPENSYIIYNFSEISSATNNFLSKRSSSASSSAWRCSLRGKDVILFQRKLRRSLNTSELHEQLSIICRSHHMSLIKLFGASISGGGDHIYLVYDFVNGANLADCLRNPRNPNFTVLSSWISRMQIAIDLAQGLEYIHHYITVSSGSSQGHIHNHIKSSSLIITEPSFNAKLCHFGTAQLCGEITGEEPKFTRSDSRKMKFQGTRGYMSPEFQTGGMPTQKTDVFAFGVVILELLSGEEPLKYIFDKEKGDYRRVSIIQTAREAMESDQVGRVRRWIDGRLKDSFPVEVAEKMTRLALDCVDSHPDKRPDMRHVAGKMSNLYLKSRKWADRIHVPTEITVSMGPR